MNQFMLIKKLFCKNIMVYVNYDPRKEYTPPSKKNVILVFY